MQNRQKTNKKSSKGLDHKKKNRLVYKCTHRNKLGHLESLCVDKLKRSKGNNLRPYGKTSAPRPKKIWVPKVKF